MNCDSYYEIGASHKECQDHASHFTFNNYACTVIVDGCSMSHDKGAQLDIGAKLIYLCAKQAVKDAYGKFDKITQGVEKEYYIAIGYKIVELFCDLKKKFDLLENALDGTVVIAISDGTTTHAHLYGDGVVCVKYENDQFCDDVIYKIDFQSGAPYYLSYLMDETKNQLYFQHFGLAPIHLNTSTIKNGVVTSNQYLMNIKDKSLVDSGFAFEFKGVKNITTFSDGVGSFVYKANNPCNYIETIQNLVSFKNYAGEFVYRKFLSNKNRVYQSNGITHFDDFSFASILTK